MANDFAMVYPGIFEGSMRDHPPYARLLFIAMLLKADHEGCVLGHPSFWAAYVNVPEDQVRQAIDILEAPDEDSTSPEHEGRRLLPLGSNRWKIVNFEAYRDAKLAEERREYWRLKKQEQRAKKEQAPSPTNGEPVPKPAKAEKPTPFVPPTKEEVIAYFAEKRWPEMDAVRFFNHFDNRKTRKWHTSGGRGPLMEDWRRTATDWAHGKHTNGAPSGSSSRGVSDQAVRDAERILEEARKGKPIIGGQDAS